MTSKNLSKDDVRIGTKDEAAWTQLMKEAISQNETNVRMIAVNEAVIELCKAKIAAEQGKL